MTKANMKKIRWGSIFAIIGVLWLAQDLGWIKTGVSIVPVVFILVGVWMIIEGLF